MRFSPSELMPISESTGFRKDVVEKVLQVMHLLNSLNSHPYLKRKWVLKGGTALNMFIFDLPRLSVDIDLNYTGTLDRDEMLKDRPQIEQAIQAVFSREGFTVRKVPPEHAGGKWRLSYQSFSGQSGNLEVDVNFMFRKPLWGVRYIDSCALGDHLAQNIAVLDPHELAAGKLAALFARGQARDLFDCHQILKSDTIQFDRLRTAFVVYGAMNRKDWRFISKEDLGFDAAELAKQLIPTLHLKKRYGRNEASEFGSWLLQGCKENLSAILPYTDSERQFLDLLLGQGEIDASLLTADKTLQQSIESQPLLKWKVLNVRRHKGLT